MSVAILAQAILAQVRNTLLGIYYLLTTAVNPESYESGFTVGHWGTASSFALSVHGKSGKRSWHPSAPITIQAFLTDCLDGCRSNIPLLSVAILLL